MDFGEPERGRSASSPPTDRVWCVALLESLCVDLALEPNDFSATVLCDFSIQTLLWLPQVLLNFLLLYKSSVKKYCQSFSAT